MSDIDNLLAHLRDHGHPLLADVIGDLSEDDKNALHELLWGRTDETQFFIPTDEALRAVLDQHPNRFELISNWIAGYQDYQEAGENYGLLKMMGGSQFQVTRDSINGLRIIDSLESFSRDEDSEIFFDVIDGVLYQDKSGFNEGPLDPNKTISSAQIMKLFSKLLTRAENLAIIEQETYGETDLFRILDFIWKQLRDLSGNPNVATSSQLLMVTDGINQRLDEIQRQQHALGRRCINIRDFGDGSKIFEAKNLAQDLDLVSEDQFIRLRNGVCWEMDSLMNFIVMQNGQNSVMDLKTGRPYKPFEAYPGVQNIWQDEDELNRILDHPAAIAAEFRTEYLEIKYGDQMRESKVVSKRTLDMMERTGRLLASEGPIFLEELDRVLDDRQRAAWRDANQDPDQIQNKEDQRDICTSIVTTLKSNALSDWKAYWDSLSQPERDFISKQNSSFSSDIDNCLEGQLCVYITTGMMFRTRNQIAQLRGLPLIERLTGGLDPAKACQGISERIMTRQEENDRREREGIGRRFNPQTRLNRNSPQWGDLVELFENDQLFNRETHELILDITLDDLEELALNDLLEDAEDRPIRTRDWPRVSNSNLDIQSRLDRDTPQWRDLVEQLQDGNLLLRNRDQADPDMSMADLEELLEEGDLRGLDDILIDASRWPRRGVTQRFNADFDGDEIDLMPPPPAGLDRNSEQWEELIQEYVMGNLRNRLLDEELSEGLSNDDLEEWLLVGDVMTSTGEPIDVSDWPRVGAEGQNQSPPLSPIRRRNQSPPFRSPSPRRGRSRSPVMEFE